MSAFIASWLPALVALVLPASSAANTDRQFEFAFWPTPASTKHPDYVRAQEGACGDLAVARVRTMPDALSNKDFGADVVYELGSTYKVLRRWSLPANTWPVAVHGTELLFAEGGKYFSVNPEGRIRHQDLQERPAWSAEATCKLPPSLRSSEFARCHAFPRIGSSKKALLALNGPCT